MEWCSAFISSLYHFVCAMTGHGWNSLQFYDQCVEWHINACFITEVK